MKPVFFITIILIFLVSCKKDENETVPEQLLKIDVISLDSKSYSKTVSLSRDIEVENAKLELKNNSFWISNLRISADKVSFDVLENIYFDKGYRFDTIIIQVKNTIIGKIPVVQARNRVSDKRQIWAINTASYRITGLPLNTYNGIEITKYIYNLEKTTSGKDSYKNYPAFAYCIDMNIDPANKMEWYLPSVVEMQEASNHYFSFFNSHVYWWTASDYESYAFPFSETNGSTKFSKSEASWIYAFREGSKEQ